MRSNHSIRTIRSNPRSRAAFVALAMFAILVAACGSSAGASVGSPIGGGGAMARDGDVVQDGTGVTGGPEPAVPGGEKGGNGADSVDDARIVRTGTMELEVTDVAQAVAAARASILGFDGYVGASATNDDGGHPVAQITYRIPVARWEEALAALRGLNGLTTKVVSEQTNAVEVTGQIVDLGARIKNLRASEAALQAIAADARRVSDVLEVEARLTDVRGQIEQLTSQLVELSDRADLGTMTTTYRVPIVAVEAAKDGWDPAGDVDQATASLLGVLQSLASLGIWFAIVWLPILLIGGALIAFIAWCLRRVGVGRSSRAVPPAAPSA